MSSGIFYMGVQEARIDCAGLTDRGAVREVNEDQFLIGRLRRRTDVRDTSIPALSSPDLPQGESDAWLLIVADGIGGLEEGQRASALVSERVFTHVSESMQVPRQQVPAIQLYGALAEAVDRAHAELRDAHGRGGAHMGTTLTAALVVWPTLHVAHVGDTRCYVLRDGELIQLTDDHTLAQQMIAEGVLAPQAAEGSRFSHLLVNAISTDSEPPKPEFRQTILRFGDALLLCSDGLNKHLSDAEIARLLARAPTAERACRSLVRHTNARGGSDNTSVVVARFTRP